MEEAVTLDDGPEADAPQVVVRVLGPVEAEVDGGRVDLRGPQTRLVLALLVANLGRVVSDDRLIEGVWWDGEPPATARKALHTHIFHLRSALGGGIERRATGYQLDVDSVAVDAAWFEARADQGSQLVSRDPARAVEVLESALDLWFGRPYEDFPDVPSLQTEAERLTQLRLAAMEHRIEASLALGRHGAVIPELQSLVAEYPLRERLHAQLMLALYRAGRQAEALRAYTRAREVLAEELGIEPSRELQDLEERILQQDPALSLAADAPGPSRVLLLTDLEASTALWDSHPGAMSEAVARHAELIADRVEASGGAVVKGTGDGVMAVLPDVEAAVRAAFEVRQALRGEDWGDLGELTARLAIDVGPVEERDGDLFGPVVNRCARILAAAHPGQVVASRDAAEALDEAPQLAITDLGEHRLKGIGRPQRIFQLDPDGGAGAEFPPLRVGDSPPVPGGERRIVRGYELREEIGSGDFGRVYRAYQTAVGRQVAVKVIRPEYANAPTFIRQFEAEAQTVAQLEHPHIVSLYDYWRDPDGAYLVMPYLRGGSLADALRRGPWNVEPALRLLDQVGAALSFAHRQGIIHRDVKPGNVLLDLDGNAYLSDFGISTRLADASGRPITTSMGYVPPEELRGEPLTVKADIYGLGALVFELLAGVRPTESGRLPSLREIRPGLPAEVEEVLSVATADDPDHRYERVEDLLRAVRRATGTDVVGAAEASAPASGGPVRNPYKGLRAFQETDAADFFGRDGLIDELLEAVQRRQLVAVVGPSGSGKSSVIRAGLLPALRAGGLEGSRGWMITTMFPGSHPFEELEAALLRVAVDRPDALLSDLESDRRGLLRVTKQILPDDDSELVLVIDQFEELFSMVADESTRRRFLESLITLASDQRGRVRTVITLRADFFDRPLEYPEFAELMRQGLVSVAPPSEEGLALAISRPARAVGLDLEPGLVGEIVADVRGEPGSLPLLQHALTELFHRREGDVLTVAAYRATGGVAGALGRRAEEIYQGLPAGARDIARQLFLRLVTVDEDTDDTRRRVRQGELRALDVDQSTLDEVIQRFASHRLLSFDQDPVTRAPTVEVSHEALLREWDRLAGWIDEERGDLVLHRRLQVSLREWEEADRDPSFLLRGARLEQAERWAESGGITPTDEELEYLHSSREQADAEAAAARRRRRVLVGALGVGLVVVSLLAVVAFRQRELAQREARQATARELAGESTLALEEDPELAILLALEAAERTRQAGEPILPEATAALHEAVQTSRLEMRMQTNAWAAEVSPDGSLLATIEGDGDAGNRVVLRDFETGEPVRSMGEGLAFVEGLLWEPEGTMLAVSHRLPPADGDPDSGGREVVVWDTRTGEEIDRLYTGGKHLGTGVGLHAVTWAASGGTLFVSGGNDWEPGPLLEWDPRDGSTRQVLQLGELWAEVEAVDPDTLVVAYRSEVLFHDVASGETIRTLPYGDLRAAWAISLLPEEGLILLGSQADRRLEARDLETGEQVWSQETPRFATAAGPGKVAAWGNSGVATVLDPATGRELVSLRGHPGAVAWARFTPDGEHLVSVDQANELRIWDITADGPPELGTLTVGPGLAATIDPSPDGEEVAVTTMDGRFLRFDQRTGEVLLELADQRIDWFFPAAVSSDWSRFAAVDAEWRGWIRDLETGERMHELPPCVLPDDFSPDGALLLVAANQADCLGPDDPVLGSGLIDLRTNEMVVELDDRTLFGPGSQFIPGGAVEPGRYLALNLEGEFVVHDLATGEALVSKPPEDDPLLDLAPDPSGRYLAGGTQNGGAFVLDLVALTEGATMEEATVFERQVHQGGVPGVAITSDGLLAAASFGALSLWDAPDDELVVEIPVETGEPPQPTFSADETELLYGDRAGELGWVVRRFPLDPERLVELAESRVTRGFTDDECRQYLDQATCP